MAYNQNIPQAADFLSASQSQILGNFMALDSTFGVDHTTFSNTSPNLGQHKQVSLYLPATVNPTPAFPVSVLYSKNSGTTPNRVTNLFYTTQPETGSAQNLQLTNLTIVPFTNGGAGSGGAFYVITPWGMVFMWGATTVSTQFPVIQFPITLTNNSYSVQLTVIGVTTSIQELSASKTTTGFSAKFGAAALMEWTVIGSL